MDGRMDVWMDGKMEGWMDGRMERWMDGRMEGWMDGRMEGGFPKGMGMIGWKNITIKRNQFETSGGGGGYVSVKGLVCKGELVGREGRKKSWKTDRKGKGCLAWERER